MPKSATIVSHKVVEMFFDMSLPVSFILSLLAGVFATLFSIHLLKPIALRVGLVDTPGGRKMHAHPVPLIGGIAIFLGYCFSLLCFNMSLHNYRGLLAGGVILILLGIVDDFKELTPRTRLIGQSIAAFLLIYWGNLAITHLGNLFFFGNVNVHFWSLPITVVFVLGFINAINMIDGHDGLAGLIVLGQALLFVFLNIQLHQLFNIFLLLILIAVLSTFLFFNLPLPWRKRASIFLGDAGSTFIGFIIAWFAINLSQVFLTQKQMDASFNPITVLWILAYPLFDLISVVFRRLHTGRSPFHGGRDHLHHLLLELGCRRSMVAFLLFLFSFSLGLIGIVLAYFHVSEPWQVLCFTFLMIAYFAVTARIA